MNLRDTFEIISLSMTPATILLSVCVLIMLWRRGTKIFRTMEMDDVDWLIMGICISFVGKIGDNAWWGVAWHNAVIDSERVHWWFSNGVFSNVIFRQGCAILAALCHLKAVLTTRTLCGLIAMGVALGVIYSILLMQP